MSLRRSGIHVTGYCRKNVTCEEAVSAGAVDLASTDLKTACENADVIVIASPVNRIAELSQQAVSFAPQHALMTDVGSTKSKLVAEVNSLLGDSANRFIGAHPIAGSEKTGVANGRATLMDGKPVIVTPTEKNEPLHFERICEFWAITGSNVLTMSPDEHDQRLASVSHVPHLVSSLLASLIDADTAPLVGSGWTDMTRVASGDPGMWSAICEHNRDAIVNQLDRLQQELVELRTRVSDTDSADLLAWLEHAKRLKDGV